MLLRSVLVFLTIVVAQGQWINYKAAGIPRTKEGRPNLAAPAPRLNGKPDLSGLWRTDPADPREIEKMLPGIGYFSVPGDEPDKFPKYFFNALADYKPDEVVMSAEANKAHAAFRALGETATCLPTGIPMGDLLPLLARQFVQTPKLIAVLYEEAPPRRIHMDGRALPVDPNPSFAGYSIGRWEGDVLVVETNGLTEAMPIDALRHPRSADMKMTERIRRRDYGHLEVQVTFEDPKFYSKPFSYKYTQTLAAEDDLLEYICENEKDAAHMRK